MALHANRWVNNGNSDNFIFWGSKITADGNYIHEIKSCLLLGRKTMTNLDSILKNRDITSLTKVRLVKVMIFPVIIHGCELDHKENWAPKNWCFWTVCWRRLLRVSWTARRSNQSILKVISPEYSLEGLMLKLKLQYFGTWCKELIHLKRPWCWERLKAGGEQEDTGWNGWMASLTQWTWAWISSGRWWRTGKLSVLQSIGSQRVGCNYDWITTTIYEPQLLYPFFSQWIFRLLSCLIWERLMLKLKLPYFGHLMQRVSSLEKTLMLGKIESRRRRGDRGWVGWMASLTCI